MRSRRSASAPALAHSDICILIDPSVPAEYRPSLKRAYPPALRLVPRWCTKIVFSFNADQPSENPAQCVTREDYRIAWITLGPGWLEQAEPLQREMLRHEVLHIGVDPLHKIALQIADALPDAAQAIAKEGIRHALERAVTDLTHVTGR